MPIRLALLVAATVCLAAPAPAQGLLDPGPATEVAPAERPEYAGYAGRLTQKEFIQAKAAAKSAHRNAVLASRAWYGYSQSRPKAMATPFTGMYGAQFQGYAFGRPSAHYATRPVLVLSR